MAAPARAATGYTIASYQWATIPATSDQLINANQAIATLVVPSFRSIDVTLTITDNIGRTASATTTIRSTLGAASGVGGFEPRLAVAAGRPGAVAAAPAPPGSRALRFELIRRPTVAMLCGPNSGRGASASGAAAGTGFPGFEEKSLTVIRPGLPWRPGAVARVLLLPVTVALTLVACSSNSNRGVTGNVGVGTGIALATPGSVTQIQVGTTLVVIGQRDRRRQQRRRDLDHCRRRTGATLTDITPTSVTFNAPAYRCDRRGRCDHHGDLGGQHRPLPPRSR